MAHPNRVRISGSALSFADFFAIAGAVALGGWIFLGSALLVFTVALNYSGRDLFEAGAEAQTLEALPTP